MSHDKRQTQWVQEVSFSEALFEICTKGCKRLVKIRKRCLAALVELKVVEVEVQLSSRDAFAYDVEELNGVVDRLRC